MNNDIIAILKLFDETKEFGVFRALAKFYPKKITNYKIARYAKIDRKTSKAILEKFEKLKVVEKFTDTEFPTYRLTKEYAKFSHICETISNVNKLSLICSQS
jgi:DNA-binding MarR family transcriptional regulator